MLLFGLFSNNAGECDQVLFITAKADKQNTKTILYFASIQFLHSLYIIIYNEKYYKLQNWIKNGIFTSGFRPLDTAVYINETFKNIYL